MNIIFNQSGQPFDAKEEWHFLTVADPGFSALVFIGEQEYGLDRIDLDAFIDRINRSNESGSLHPKAPISAIPCKYFRNLSDSTVPTELEEFKKHIEEFLTVNSKTIKSKNLAIDFRVTPSPVPQQYIDATLEVLKEHKAKTLKNVVIY